MEKPPSALDRPGLSRVLGPWMGTAIVIGTVIGSGVFKKPHAISRDVNEFGMVMIVWVLVGLAALIGSLCLAEIAVLYPRAGGNYVFLREGFGRWAGFLYGWVEFCIIRSASIAALAAVFAESLHGVLRGVLRTGSGNVFPDWGESAITVAVIIALALVNCRGTTWGGALQLVVTTVKVLSLVAIAALPFLAFFFISEGPSRPSFDRLEPIWPESVSAINWSKFGAAMIGAIWAYHGWMNLGPVAEEVREPGRNIPLSLIAGTLTVIAVYVSANFAYYLVVPRDVMADEHQGGTTPVAAIFSYTLLGHAGMVFASAAVMTSVFGALNGNLLVGPRLLYAMGKDRLAPPDLSHLHARYRTPAIAILTLAGWSVVLVGGTALLMQLSLIPPHIKAFDVLTDYAMFGSVTFETLAIATLFAFRRRYPKSQVNLPYRCPLFPLLPTIYILVMTGVLSTYFQEAEKRTQALSAVTLIVVGAVVYCIIAWTRRGQAPADPLPIGSN
jgi:amino acid transporter